MKLIIKIKEFIICMIIKHNITAQLHSLVNCNVYFIRHENLDSDTELDNLYVIVNCPKYLDIAINLTTVMAHFHELWSDHAMADTVTWAISSLRVKIQSTTCYKHLLVNSDNKY